MRLAVVVQRYGAEISGGAERHARHLAEHLARFADVRVLTTCARDYVTWKNDLPPGEERVGGIPVERFPVAHERSLPDFARRSRYVFDQTHSIADELAWMDSQGPASPALVDRLTAAQDEFDFALFFCARYYQAFHGCRAVPAKAVLVPTAEREPSIGLAILAQVFRGVRAVMYNSPEEQALVNALSGNAHVPGAVVGVGVDVERTGNPARFRHRHGVDSPYVIYVGRIDENKGCTELFAHYRAFARTMEHPPQLLLAGSAVMPVPEHPLIRQLGFLSDEDKLDAMAGATALVMPSRFESLSMVVLEAWALGRPVLVNARCEVLLGQCLRANGGLYYENATEFSAALRLLLDQPDLAARLGANGQTYCRREYAWPVVEDKYAGMLEALRRASPGSVSPMEPLPGWWARRRRNMPGAAARVAAVARTAIPGQEYAS
ncbi:MAG: glycosyltransferase family 4 protein [Vicinamibacterales bacterium]